MAAIGFGYGEMGGMLAAQCTFGRLGAGEGPSGSDAITAAGLPVLNPYAVVQQALTIAESYPGDAVYTQMQHLAEFVAAAGLTTAEKHEILNLIPKHSVKQIANAYIAVRADVLFAGGERNDL